MQSSRRTSLPSTFPQSTPLQGSFHFRTWNGSIRNRHLRTIRPIPGLCCMAPPSVLPPPFFLRVSSAQLTGNTTKIPRSVHFPTLASSHWANKCQNRDSEIPRWLVQDLTDRAAKRGKGQQPILVGAIYRGKHAHVAFKAGGNDLVQHPMRSTQWRTQLTPR